MKQVIENLSDLKAILPDCRRIRIKYYLSSDLVKLILNSKVKSVSFSCTSFRKSKKELINLLKSNGINILVNNRMAGRRPKYLFNLNKFDSNGD